MNRIRFVSLFAVLALALGACTAPLQAGTPTAGAGAEPTGAPDQASPTAEAITESAPTETSVPSAAPETTPDASTTPDVAPAPAGWIAFIGTDGNLRLVERSTGEERQITEDAVLMQPNSTAEPIRYCCMKWSPDGSLLAYMREESVKLDNAYDYRYTLSVYDPVVDASRTLLEGQNVLGYDWRPGTHVIAYGLPVKPDYWISREAVRAESANGIWTLDADSGETQQLIEPQHGFTLGLPRWSPDGRLLGFEEIRQMEGRGYFAWYDTAGGQYVALEEVIGSYSWSPDGAQLAYDQIGYRPIGGEQIWLRPLAGGEPRALSPELDLPQYAFAPAVSPDGERVAYLANLNGAESEQFIFNVFVIDVNGGNLRDYGTFEQVWQLNWTSDGAYLVFSAGPFENKTVFEVDLASGTVREVTQGAEAVPQPGPAQ